MLGLRIARSLIRVYGGRKLKTEIFRPSHRHQSRSRLDLARLAHDDNFRRPLRGSRKGCRSHDPSSTRIARTAPPAEPWHGRRPRRSGNRERDLHSPHKPFSEPASRRLWTAVSITALSACGARLPVLPTRPPPNKPHLKFQISNLKSPHRAAGSGLLGASQLSLRAEHAYTLSPQAPLPTRPPSPFRILTSHFSLLTSHFSLLTSPFPPPRRSAGLPRKPSGPPHRPTNQPPSQSQCFTTRFRRFSTAPEKSASTVKALAGSGTGVGS
jgi:hypothetical protein